jgi:hypothetical protein
MACGKADRLIDRNDNVKTITLATQKQRFSRSVLVLAMIGFWVLMAHAASAAGYYVAPKGSGSACTKTSPCSLQTGLSKGRSGDEVVLLSGTYNTPFDTQHEGVLIRADERHKAVLRYAKGHVSGNHIIGIKHDKITIRGLRVDGERTAGAGHGLIRFYTSRNVVVEDNIVENGAGGLISIGGSRPDDSISKVVVRHNLLQGAGLNSEYGEGIYIGSYQGTSVKVRDVEIYGNTLRLFSDNGIDIKPPTENVRVHHNIFEDQVERGGTYGNTGTLVMQGSHHEFHANIIRNVIGGSAVLNVVSRGDSKVYNNVIRNSKNTSRAVRSRGSGSGGATTVTHNLFCDLSSTQVDTGGNMMVRNNPGLDLPREDCLTREKEIEREMGRELPKPDPSEPVLSAPSQLSIVEVK